MIRDAALLQKVFAYCYCTKNVQKFSRYSCLVLGVAGVSAINKLQKLQNRAARIVTNSAYDASAHKTIIIMIVRKLGRPTINKLIESETLKMIYKSVNDQAFTYPTEMFVRLSNSSKRELRNTKKDLAVSRSKSAFAQNCFLHKGAKLWSDLSNEVKSPKTYEISQKTYQQQRQQSVLILSRLLWLAVFLICI